MIRVPSNLPLVDARVTIDPAQPAAPADTAGLAQPPAGASAGDPLAAFGAMHGLHKDVARFADSKTDKAQLPPGDAPVLETKNKKKDAAQAPIHAPTAAVCKAPDKTYDLAKVTPDVIKDLRACGQRQLADTIEHAKASYADLLALNPPAKLYVTLSAGNGGVPVLVVKGPKFDPQADAHVHTHYHGDNATVADPLGSKAGVNARIREVILNKDPQAVFVLPEASNSTAPDKLPRTHHPVDSPAMDNKYPVNWSNVKDQVQTTKDALAAAGVTKVGESVVSAHSGGGMALVNLINADKAGGTLLRADRLELYDCMYHFNIAPIDGKPNPRYFTEQRLADWSKTPNGQAVKQVNFYEAGSDSTGARAKVVERAFPAHGGQAVFKLYPMSKEPSLFDANGKIDPKVDPVARDVHGNTIEQKVLVRPQDDKPPVAHNYRPTPHYRTVGERLGDGPQPRP